LNQNRVKSFFANVHRDNSNVVDDVSSDNNNDDANGGFPLQNPEEHETVHKMCNGKQGIYRKRPTTPAMMMGGGGGKSGSSSVKAEIAAKLGMVLTAERAGVFIPLSVLSTCLGYGW
jgi:hypothetical protein